MDLPLTQTVELVRRAKNGERDALDRLFARYYERVRARVRPRISRKLRGNLVDSVDVVQETFLTAAQKLDSFEMRDRGSWINWLVKLAEHQITDFADYYSAQKRDSTRAVPLIDGEGDDRPGAAAPPDHGPSPLERAASDEEVQILESCLRELPTEYQELILLHMGGLSWQQIAEKCQRPTAGAARMMHQKAITTLSKRVRRAMDSHGPAGAGDD